MNRRRFLHTGIMAGAMLTASRAHAHQPSNLSQSASMSSNFELEEATIADLQSGIANGKYTARSIVEQYLARIAAVDKGSAGLNSVIELNPDAISIADTLDRDARAGRVRGVLHGIPVLLKDNIDTHDKMTTTAGSLALEGSIPSRDAFIVEGLRRAGCVIIGKTNLSEWANFRSTRSSSGWSGRGGQTHNPYALDRNPCGSSSGSGVSVAANLCSVAVGTETDGSIVCPSSANGIVGIKPTVGLVSRSGIIPISHTQDTAGAMTRTVTDAAILLGAMTGVDARDAATRASRSKSHTDYTRFLDAQGLRGARIGVLRKSFGFNMDVDKLMEDSIDAMKRAGAIIIDPVAIETAGKFGDSELEVLLYEFKDGLNKYLATLEGNTRVKTLKDIIAFNERERAREMPYFGQELFLRAEAKGDLRSREYKLALAKNRRLSRTLGIDATMTKHKLDAIVAPTGSPAWTTDLINGDHFSGGSSTPAAVAGYPNINVPAGFVFGLPVGISFFGRAYSEPVLIKLAYSYEQATKHRRAPRLLTQADLNAKV
ncbi:MAG: amidase [Pyrinomonadaceae bacterium MAG19_C2-C3]|nr:amidase [Pyrinomonadaceae bacterium MAG19_C2-C3]